jgi:hypothetical protein
LPVLNSKKMTYCGKYEPVTNKYDLHHEINNEVAKLTDQLTEINDFNSEENAKAIKKALLEIIIENL